MRGLTSTPLMGWDSLPVCGWCVDHAGPHMYTTDGLGWHLVVEGGLQVSAQLQGGAGQLQQ